MYHILRADQRGREHDDDGGDDEGGDERQNESSS
jgi:hypothetical protein